MLQKSLEELAQTEGGRTAIKIIKQNKILQIVILILYILNLCFYMLMYDHKEVYTYYYLAYAKKKLEKKQGSSSKWLYHLYISFSVLLQGDFERAFFILNQIDRRELDRSKQYLIFRFHQNMRIYYCIKNDEAVLNNMRNYFVQMSEDKHFKRLYRKWIKKEIEMIDLHCSLNRGDFTVYEYLSRQPEWTKGDRLQRVATHLMDAKVHNMQKNQEAAMLDCQYVIENGNRLYYVSMAKQMLSFIESSQKGRADEISVQPPVSETE